MHIGVSPTIVAKTIIIRVVFPERDHARFAGCWELKGCHLTPNNHSQILSAPGWNTHWGTWLEHTLGHLAGAHIGAPGWNTHWGTWLEHTLGHLAGAHIGAPGWSTHWGTCWDTHWGACWRHTLGQSPACAPLCVPSMFPSVCLQYVPLCVSPACAPMCVPSMCSNVS